MPSKTVRVSNLSLRAAKVDILNFFSFSGEIESIVLQREGEDSQIAYVTFKDSDALDTALLLSGATIVDRAVNIEVEEDTIAGDQPQVQSSQQYVGGGNRAQDIMSSMLSKGYILGKDTMNKAKTFDEKHQLTANATSTINLLDKKIGISEKISAGAATVNQGVKAVDERFHVSERTKLAIATAEEKITNASSALMKNKFVFTGTAWVTGAFSKVSKMATEVSQGTKEKVESSQTS